jgi:hypothetical protein
VPPGQAPASQHTPEEQLPLPAQLTAHEAPEQLTRWHALIPAQLTVVDLAVLETLPAHESVPEHATTHLVPLHVTSR